MVNGFPKLRLEANDFGVPNDWTVVRSWPELQEAALTETGILVPLLSIEQNRHLTPVTARLYVNDTVVLDSIDLYESLSPERLVAALRTHAAEFISPELIEYALVKLSSSLPVVARAAREQMDIPNICAELQSRLNAGQSVRNLAGILEEMLERVAAPLTGNIAGNSSAAEA